MRVIAVDFDGTLAHYNGYRGPGVLGEPVLNMLEKVKRWVAEGHEVYIHTARVFFERDDMDGMHEADINKDAIIAWLATNGLPRLRVTCMKLKHTTEFWDDRAVAVQKNTGLGFVAPPEGYRYMLVKADDLSKSSYMVSIPPILE